MALALFSLASCSSIPKGTGGAVTKVKIYSLNPSARLRAADPSLTFERQYHLYGAITQAEQLERAGQYYSVFWKADDRSQPVTVKFEYRQRSTGLAVKVKEVEITEVNRSNITKFEVIGEESRTGGQVTAWRASIMRGKEQLATAESYLWN